MKVYVDGSDMLDALAAADPDVVGSGDSVRTRRNLARWLARYAEDQDCDVLLVFEEPSARATLAPVEHYGRTRVVNLEPGVPSIHEIAGAANRAARSQRVLVVTSNRRLADALRRSGARVLEPIEFIERAGRVVRGAPVSRQDEPEGKFSGVPDADVQYWLRFFARHGRGTDGER